MRKLFLRTLAVVLLATSSTAFAAPTLNISYSYQEQEQRTEITMEEVPDAVQDSWKEESNYAQSEVLAIYDVQTESESYIEFVVRKDGQKLAVHFDKEGNLLREKVMNT